MSSKIITLMILLLAGCAGIPAKPEQAPELPRESRGVWLDKGQMLEGKESLLARLDRLQAAGFNTIYVATQVRGYAIYPGSKVLPQWDEAAAKVPDILDWLLPAIHQRGMRAEAWTEFGFYAYHTPDATKDPSRGPLLNAHPELTAIDRDGTPYLHNVQWGDFYSLCPSNPKSHEILSELYIEMLEKYDFDGINLDRIRYPEITFCYCDYCREHFKRDTGLALGSFAEGSEEQQAFIRWRKEQLTAFMKSLSSRLRRRFPRARLTSAVVPPGMMDGKGQDWPSWLAQGYLDAAMPMLYAADISGMVEEIQRRVPAEAWIFYGLDAGQGIETLSRQVLHLRAVGAPGFTVWYSGSVDPLLPAIQRDLLKAPAVSPLYSSEQDK